MRYMFNECGNSEGVPYTSESDLAKWKETPNLVLLITTGGTILSEESAYNEVTFNVRGGNDVITFFEPGL